MSRNAGKDFPVSPETEQLLSGHVCGESSNTHAGLLSEISGISTLQNRFGGLSRNAQSGEIGGNQVAVFPVTVNNNESNDDPPPYSAIPPPYSAIAPPDYISCQPYGLFSFGNRYSAESPSYRVEIPLTSFQTSLTAGFHPEVTDGQQHTSYPSTTLTPYRFFKFNGNSSVSREISFTDNGIVEKVDDKKTRRYGTILVAAAVIIFLMLLSLMVRFIMEKSWWRR
ncbi:uncharacterized protein LOC109852314 [Pseudomyrmex gracilis]|uniref:uncharacterized protein LOC109852314 n=1 Tax=Pseudomyrmex gracilis TaxID=219809 RepID=UPI000995646E|nr:uncharacterized protein LOC109852314 [Pseudomyrmex gracilis]